MEDRNDVRKEQTGEVEPSDGNEKEVGSGV